jgi:hypothetical protein
MISRNYALLSFIAAAFGGGSFVATYAWQPPTPSQPFDGPGPATCASRPCGPSQCCKSLSGWLQVTPQQQERLGSVDAGFIEDQARLEAALFAERQKLAELFESADSSGEAILQQVERVIEADNTLERRVAKHLVALAPHLTNEQRGRLYGHCAKYVRDAGGCRWRHQGNDGAGCGPGSPKSVGPNPRQAGSCAQTASDPGL